MITVQDDHKITTIRLENGKVNTLDLDMLADLSAVFRSLHGRDEGAVILTGVGSSFSAGVDLRKIIDGGSDYIHEFLPALSAAILNVFQCPLPVVAAVNGHAVAGGCLLAAAADVRLMGKGRIGVPEFAVGVPLPVAGIEVLRSAVGHHAHTLITSAEMVTVDEAEKLGLVTAVAPDNLQERALGEARRLAEVSPSAFTATKTQLHAPVLALIEANAALDQQVASGWVTALKNGRIGKYLASLTR
ncbi:enoyl-CoA hydratase/isomerase family protein [Arthrobacter sp. OAP107]|uniref:enoyl-CoA hydratase/isomerase family protein n=1 Tax=Arthrobacter sp. OAP107 TaxID=3156445 RepID=UPI00339A237A